MAGNDGPILFVSYARADVEYPPFLECLKVFIADLQARVATGLAVAPDDVCFRDGVIPAGDLYSDRIRDAIMTCKVGLALYSPNYFSRPWCGKEFQILLDRGQSRQAGTGIIPVLWTKDISDPPGRATQIQYRDESFPPEYSTRGMRKLVELRSSEPHKQIYSDTLDALTDRIVAAAKAQHLAPLAELDIETVESAWETSAAVDPRSHTRGNISKTCFVYLSRDGWAWVPYQGAPATIGALAQKVSGELGIRYEEITCDAELPRKLKETNDNDVPTVLFGDPASLFVEPYARSLRQYDTQYLLNCAALVPWEPHSRDMIETDRRWLHLKNEVCPQKVASPPPYHEWRSIFSPDDLSQKTSSLIEQIRSRLMNRLVSEQSKAGLSRRAENASVAESAAAQGIDVGSLPGLSGPGQ